MRVSFAILAAFSAALFAEAAPLSAPGAVTAPAGNVARSAPSVPMVARSLGRREEAAAAAAPDLEDPQTYKLRYEAFKNKEPIVAQVRSLLEGYKGEFDVSAAPEGDKEVVDFFIDHFMDMYGTNPDAKLSKLDGMFQDKGAPTNQKRSLDRRAGEVTAASKEEIMKLYTDLPSDAARTELDGKLGKPLSEFLDGLTEMTPEKWQTVASAIFQPSTKAKRSLVRRFKDLKNYPVEDIKSKEDALKMLEAPETQDQIVSNALGVLKSWNKIGADKEKAAIAAGEPFRFTNPIVITDEKKAFNLLAEKWETMFPPGSVPEPWTVFAKTVTQLNNYDPSQDAPKIKEMAEEKQACRRRAEMSPVVHPS